MLKKLIIAMFIFSSLVYGAELNINIPDDKLDLLFNSIVDRNKKSYKDWRTNNPEVNKYLFIKYRVIEDFKNDVYKYQRKLKANSIVIDNTIAG